LRMPGLLSSLASPARMRWREEEDEMQRGASPAPAGRPSLVLLPATCALASPSSPHHYRLPHPRCIITGSPPSRLRHQPPRRAPAPLGARNRRPLCRGAWLRRRCCGSGVWGWEMETVERDPRRALVVIRSEARLGDELDVGAQGRRRIWSMA
jgi:hypothetical protein